VRTWIRHHQIELKYLVIGRVVLAALIALDRSQVLGNLDHVVKDILDASRGIGAVGMFLIALTSNCAVFVQIPYTLPLLSAAIGGSSLADLTVLGVAAGIGAGFGEVIKYHVAHRVLAKRPELHRSRLFQWVERQAAEKPRHVKWIVFVWAATILPDDTVIIPLAMIRYGLRRIAFPLFTGKVAHNLSMVLLFYLLSDTAKNAVEAGVRVDLAFALLVAFFLVVFYQVEKSLHHERVDQTLVAEPATE
jgi:hypothetical protein